MEEFVGTYLVCGYDGSRPASPPSVRDILRILLPGLLNEQDGLQATELAAGLSSSSPQGGNLLERLSVLEQLYEGCVMLVQD